jgi:hypothetical protein
LSNKSFFSHFSSTLFFPLIPTLLRQLPLPKFFFFPNYIYLPTYQPHCPPPLPQNIAKLDAKKPHFVPASDPGHSPHLGEFNENIADYTSKESYFSSDVAKELNKIKSILDVTMSKLQKDVERLAGSTNPIQHLLTLHTLKDVFDKIGSLQLFRSQILSLEPTMVQKFDILHNHLYPVYFSVLPALLSDALTNPAASSNGNGGNTPRNINGEPSVKSLNDSLSINSLHKNPHAHVSLEIICPDGQAMVKTYPIDENVDHVMADMIPRLFITELNPQNAAFKVVGLNEYIYGDYSFNSFLSVREHVHKQLTLQVELVSMDGHVQDRAYVARIVKFWKGLRNEFYEKASAVIDPRELVTSEYERYDEDGNFIFDDIDDSLPDNNKIAEKKAIHKSLMDFTFNRQSSRASENDNPDLVTTRDLQSSLLFNRDDSDVASPLPNTSGRGRSGIGGGGGSGGPARGRDGPVVDDDDEMYEQYNRYSRGRSVSRAPVMAHMTIAFQQQMDEFNRQSLHDQQQSQPQSQPQPQQTTPLSPNPTPANNNSTPSYTPLSNNPKPLPKQSPPGPSVPAPRRTARGGFDEDDEFRSRFADTRLRGVSVAPPTRSAVLTHSTFNAASLSALKSLGAYGVPEEDEEDAPVLRPLAKCQPIDFGIQGNHHGMCDEQSEAEQDQVKVTKLGSANTNKADPYDFDEDDRYSKRVSGVINIPSNLLINALNSTSDRRTGGFGTLRASTTVPTRYSDPDEDDFSIPTANPSQGGMFGAPSTQNGSGFNPSFSKPSPSPFNTPSQFNPQQSPSPFSNNTSSPSTPIIITPGSNFAPSSPTNANPRDESKGVPFSVPSVVVSSAKGRQYGTMGTLKRRGSITGHQELPPALISEASSTTPIAGVEGHKDRRNSALKTKPDVETKTAVLDFRSEVRIERDIKERRRRSIAPELQMNDSDEEDLGMARSGLNTPSTKSNGGFFKENKTQSTAAVVVNANDSNGDDNTPECVRIKSHDASSYSGSLSREPSAQKQRPSFAEPTSPKIQPTSVNVSTPIIAGTPQYETMPFPTTPTNGEKKDDDNFGLGTRAAPSGSVSSPSYLGVNRRASILTPAKHSLFKFSTLTHDDQAQVASLLNGAGGNSVGASSPQLGTFHEDAGDAPQPLPPQFNQFFWAPFCAANTINVITTVSRR